MRSGLFSHLPYPPSYPSYHKYGGDGESEDISHVHALRSHSECKGKHVSHWQIEQPVGCEGNGHDDFHVLYAAQHAYRHVLHTVGELEQGAEDKQRRGYADDLGVRREQRGQKVTERYEDDGGKRVPRQHQMV